MDGEPHRDRAAYMRDYRRRRRLNNHQPLGVVRKPGPEVHRACDETMARQDRRIAELEARIAELEGLAG